MSSTDAALAWLLSVDAACTSSPVPTSASPDFTDWLRISPTTDSPTTQPTSQPQSSSPPFKDVSSSSRVNLPERDDFGLNYLYDLPDLFNIETIASSRTGTDIIPSSLPPAMFNHHHRMLSLESTSATLIDSPSPRHLVAFSPSGTIVEQSETGNDFQFSPTKFMQELQYTSFGNYYRDLTVPSLFADSISDISPVVRADKLQESIPPDNELIPDTKPKRKKKSRRTRNLPRSSSFVEKLHAATSSSKPPSTPSSSRIALEPVAPFQRAHVGLTEDVRFPTAVLLSPCRLVSNHFSSGRIQDPSQEPIAYNSYIQNATTSAILESDLASPSPAPKILSPLSPLTPLSSSPGSALPPKIVLKLKIKFSGFSTPVSQSKRPRVAIVESPLSLSSPLSSPGSSPEYSPLAENRTLRPLFTIRTLPTNIEMASNFPLFYRRFPASSYYQPGHLDSPCTLFRVSHPGGIYNPPRSALDLYTPRFVRGKGVEKVGLCPICVESLARGGQNKKNWFAMKFSAFKCYHMQYAHGISASTGRPFSPPTAFRILVRQNPGKNEKLSIQQGKCHKCAKWVAVEGIKDMESKVKELHWWKHAAACHHGTTLEGEGDYYEDDNILRRILSLKTGPA